MTAWMAPRSQSMQYSEFFVMERLRIENGLGCVFTFQYVMNVFLSQTKSGKPRQQRQGSPISPKLEGKRLRTPFHRRSPPIEKLLNSSAQNVMPAPPQPSTTVGGHPVRSSVSSDQNMTAHTPQVII